MSDTHRSEYFACSCHNPECVVAVDLYISPADDKYPEIRDLCFHVQLNRWQPWYKRLWNAIGYVWCGQSKYYHWAETYLKKEDIARLRSLLDEFEADGK
jgi:hypothetical protein